MKLSFPLLTLSISIVLLWSCVKPPVETTHEQYEEVLNMGGDFDPFPELSANMGSSTDQAYNRFLVKLTQKCSYRFIISPI